MIQLPVEWFARRHIGDLVSRFGATQPIVDLASKGLIAAVVDGIIAVLTLSMILPNSPLLATLVLAALVLQVGLRIGTFRLLWTREEEAIEAAAREQTTFIETAHAMQSIRLFWGGGAAGGALAEPPSRDCEPRCRTCPRARRCVRGKGIGVGRRDDLGRPGWRDAGDFRRPNRRYAVCVHGLPPAISRQVARVGGDGRIVPSAGVALTTDSPACSALSQGCSIAGCIGIWICLGMECLCIGSPSCGGGLQQFVERQGQIPHALAGGIEDGIGDGCGDAGERTEGQTVKRPGQANQHSGRSAFEPGHANCS